MLLLRLFTIDSSFNKNNTWDILFILYIFLNMQSGSSIACSEMTSSFSCHKRCVFPSCLVFHKPTDVNALLCRSQICTCVVSEHWTLSKSILSFETELGKGTYSYCNIYVCRYVRISHGDTVSRVSFKIMFPCRINKWSNPRKSIV